MRAIRFENHGGYEELALADVPVPEPSEGEVLLRMSAAAVNPLDDAVRLGRFQAARPSPRSRETARWWRSGTPPGPWPPSTSWT